MDLPASLNDTHPIAEGLWTQGYARLGTLLDPKTCRALRDLWNSEDMFRSTIDMARYRFGEGSYRYFAYPLPDVVGRLRANLYPELAPIANAWMKALGFAQQFPPSLKTFLSSCHRAGQTRPTPLMLRYEMGGYNCLHQDLYGDIVFPFQIIVGLSDPHKEYAGGELLLVEQRPRAQSVGHVINLEQGEGVVITTRYRPVKGARGYYRTNMRHGVSRVTNGERFTLGIIFHDAK